MRFESFSALQVNFNVMRSINSRFTYLLTKCVRIRLRPKLHPYPASGGVTTLPISLAGLEEQRGWKGNGRIVPCIQRDTEGKRQTNRV